MLPKATVVHRTARRLRVKIPSRKGDEGFFARLREEFAARPEVEECAVNALTGSLLLVGGGDVGEVAKQAEEKGLFSLEKAALQAVQAPLHQRVSDYAGKLDRQVRRAFGEEFGVAGLTFLFFLGLGLYQVIRGNLAAPAWYVSFWYALMLFPHWQPQPAA